MDTLIAAVVSSRSRFCDTEANLKHFASLTRRAAGRDARLVCFPELALSSYTTRPEALEVAEKIPGPSTEALCEIAAAYDVFVSMGMPERAGSEYHIAQVVVGPEGRWSTSFLEPFTRAPMSWSTTRQATPSIREAGCGSAAGRWPSIPWGRL